jgi:hypothetical protein
MADGKLIDQIELPPGAELVGGSDDVLGTHLAVLGTLEKVNHEVQPEASEFLRGKKSTRTYYLPQNRKTSQVADFFKEQLAGEGEIAFSCKGRGCGSSSLWANQIFDRAILYGPEQYQYYLIASIDDAYLAVYIGQRATRKIYVYLEQLEP